MFAENAVQREHDVDGLSRARGLIIGVGLSALIWGILAVIKLTLS